MMALVQRVRSAHVEVQGREVGRIGAGMLALVCAERGDTDACCDRLVARLLKLRIFSDAQGKMNLSLQNLDGCGRSGGLLLVSQFTLAADLSGGNRPSFAAAADPADGLRCYQRVVATARAAHPQVACGVFGADMQVHLINDGPVTLPVRVSP